jgi:hypothetical protein
MSRLLSSLGQDAGKQHQVQYQTLFKWQRALVPVVNGQENL